MNEPVKEPRIMTIVVEVEDAKETQPFYDSLASRDTKVLGCHVLTIMTGHVANLLETSEENLFELTEKHEELTKTHEKLKKKIASLAK